MERNCLKHVLRDHLEDLAHIEHERWSHWQKYMHSRGVRQADGGLLFPAPLIEQWDRQIATRYADLSENEKGSDREQVLKYLRLVAGVISGLK